MIYVNQFKEQEQVFCDGKKLKALQKIIIYKVLKKAQTISTKHLIQEVNSEGAKITVSQRHINRFRVVCGLSRSRGRPSEESKSLNLAELKSNISHVGVHIFDSWMEERKEFSEIITNLEECIEGYKAEHPGDKFRLLYYKRETQILHFKAIFYAPFFDIGKLSEYDHQENPLNSLIGRSYQSSTLNQYLGYLERIDAAKAIKKILIPVNPGEIGYVDGVMIPYWTKTSMHKGYITMLGRIMAGSQAVITHNESCQSVYFLYYPPDTNLSPIVLDYCQEVSQETGIVNFIIDRAVNSEENARKFQEKGLGLLCMLDANEYKGLSDFETRELGKIDDVNNVYEGVWKDTIKKENNSRKFVIVEEKEKILVYWGNEKFKEYCPFLEWPKIYRDRTEIQENSFKRMTSHGKLKVNFGIKKIMGPDRHQGRKIAESHKKLESTEKKSQKQGELVTKQIQKIAESSEKCHNKLLLKRQTTLDKLQKKQKELYETKEKLQTKLDALKPDKQRADRDFRKQNIMTFRTLLLENLLLAFFALLLPNLTSNISLDVFMDIFFKRSGSYAETSSTIIYWVNTKGLSVTYKNTLLKIAEGITKMSIKCRGKPIQVRLK